MATIGSGRASLIRVKTAPGLFAFTTFTFSTGGSVGQTGPTAASFSSNNTYTSQLWYSSYFSVGTVTLGVQSWTVPATSNYRITVRGASGGANNGGTYYPGLPGQGALIQGDFALIGGTVLNLVVGQAGVYGFNGSGGGGGSFVYTGSIGGSGILISAGGGGGWGHGSAAFTQVSAGVGSATTSPTSGTSSAGTAASGGTGQGGLGGSNTVYGSAGGGTGWFSQGSNGQGSTSFVAGGGLRWTGGTPNGSGADAVNTGQGGYGGGGGWGGNNGAAGGGGGYSGGGGGNGYDGNSWGAGGGGGSYNAGSSQSNTAGTNIGYSENGYITITKL